jgi:hypothetical protein
MISPRIRLSLAEPSRVYHPTETLSGQFSLEGVSSNNVRAIELSVLWHTEGKGDEDMSVHFFERFDLASGEAFDFRQPRHFSTPLPNSPLSYSGLIVKIRWCVRVRVFLDRGKDLTLEVPFQLGTVPKPQAAAT